MYTMLKAQLAWMTQQLCMATTNNIPRGPVSHKGGQGPLPHTIIIVKIPPDREGYDGPSDHSGSWPGSIQGSTPWALFLHVSNRGLTPSPVPGSTTSTNSKQQHQH